MKMSPQLHGESPERASPAGVCQCLSIPDGPDKHDESSAVTYLARRDLLVVGALVRGHRHKHEGTNCDDWFEVATTGNWTFIAVSDGAESRKLSRVGARAACVAAVEHLRRSLGSPDGSDEFAPPDLERMRRAVQDAMGAGRKGVEEAFCARADGPEYGLVLGRAPTLDDLSCTLLVTVHWTAGDGPGGESRVVSCQIGSGITGGIVGDRGTLVLLGRADSGEDSSQTDFLTSGSLASSKESLDARTFSFTGRLRTLVSMTDGVSNVYEPENPHLLRLEADLVLNGVLPGPQSSDEAAAAALEGTHLSSLDALRRDPPGYRSNSTIHCKQRPVHVWSLQPHYAEALGVEWQDIVREPDLLAAGRDDVRPALPPEEHLRLWLDALQAGGEFDDRTLVVLHRGWDAP